MIINANDWYNKGDVSNRLAMVYALKKNIKDLKITLESKTVEEDRTYFSKFNVNVIQGIFAYNENESFSKKMLKSLLSLSLLSFYALLYKLLHIYPLNGRQRESIYITRMIKADLVLSSAGGFLHDEAPFSSLLPHLFLIGISVLLNKPTILYAQSIGPLKHTLIRYLVKKVLSEVNMIILREEISLRELQELNIRKPKVFVTTDASFALRRFLKIRHRTSTESYMRIGITVIGKWKDYDPHKYNNYICAMAEAIDYLTEKHKATIVFLPQRLARIDYRTAQQVYHLVRNKKHVVLDTSDYTPEELMEVIADLDFMIGTRLHSCILSLVVGIPIIAIEYQPKTSGVMQMLLLDNWIIPINGISGHQLILKIEELLSKKLEIRQYINQKVDDISFRSELSAKIVKNFIDELVNKKHEFSAKLFQE